MSESSDYTQKLIDKYIEFNPKNPSEARTSTCPVWTLIGHYKGYLSDNTASESFSLTREDYEIEADELMAAIAFYDRYRSDIDVRLRQNQAF